MIQDVYSLRSYRLTAALQGDIPFDSGDMIYDLREKIAPNMS